MPLTHVLEIEASPKTVFEAITTPAGLASWWTAKVEGSRAEPGATFVFHFRSPFNPRLQVTEIEPTGLLAWEGVGGHDAWGPTTIRFQLDPTAGGTVVRFWHQMGPERAADSVAAANFNWAYYLDSLRLACETGAGKPYRPGDPTARVGATTHPQA